MHDQNLSDHFDHFDVGCRVHTLSRVDMCVCMRRCTASLSSSCSRGKFVLLWVAKATSTTENYAFQANWANKGGDPQKNLHQAVTEFRLRVVYERV